MIAMGVGGTVAVAIIGVALGVGIVAALIAKFLDRRYGKW